MPTYAYRCRDCGHELEVHQGFADAALTECPVCGGVLRKQYGTVGVTFNGSGFYRTDSRAGGGGEKKGDSGDGGSGSKESGSKDAGSKESSSKADAPKKDAAKPAAASSTSA